MSNIIKKGNYPEKNKIICKECGCIFQYYNSEVITDITTPDEVSFFGGFGVYKHIDCPTCNANCEISYNFEKNKGVIEKVKEWFYGRFRKG